MSHIHTSLLDGVDDRLRDGFEELRTRRVLDDARAFRDGDAPTPKRGPAVLRESGRKEAGGRKPERVQLRAGLTELDSLDEQIHRIARQERRIIASDKIFTVVIDRRTTQSIVVAHARLPKLDLPNNACAGHHRLARTDRSVPAQRRSGDGQARREDHGEGKLGARREGKEQAGSHTHRPVRIEHRRGGGPTKALKPHAAFAAKASDEVTSWKCKRPQKLVRGWNDRLKALSNVPTLHTTWKKKVLGVQASVEVTEWKGDKTLQKQQQSWLDNSEQFQTLLASFAAHYPGPPVRLPPLPSAAVATETTSFFLAEVTRPPACGGVLTDVADAQPHNHTASDASSDNERDAGDEDLPRIHTQRSSRLTIVAPSIESDSDHVLDDDDAANVVVDARELRKCVLLSACTPTVDCDTPHPAGPQSLLASIDSAATSFESSFVETTKRFIASFACCREQQPSAGQETENMIVTEEEEEEEKSDPTVFLLPSSPVLHPVYAQSHNRQEHDVTNEHTQRERGSGGCSQTSTDANTQEVTREEPRQVIGHAAPGQEKGNLKTEQEIGKDDLTNDVIVTSIDASIDSSIDAQAQQGALALADTASVVREGEAAFKGTQESIEEKVREVSR